MVMVITHICFVWSPHYFVVIFLFRSKTHSSAVPLPSSPPDVLTQPFNNIDHLHPGYHNNPSSAANKMNGPVLTQHHLSDHGSRKLGVKSEVLPTTAISTGAVVEQDSSDTELQDLRKLRSRELKVGTKTVADQAIDHTPLLLPQRGGGGGGGRKLNSSKLLVGGSNGGVKTIFNGNLRKVDSTAVESGGLNPSTRCDSGGGMRRSPIPKDRRNRTAPSLRTRPYTINHKASS